MSTIMFFWGGGVCLSGIGKRGSVAKQLFLLELQNSVQNKPNTKNSRRPDKSMGEFVVNCLECVCHCIQFTSDKSWTPYYEQLLLVIYVYLI